MNISAKDLFGYKIKATDGEIGHVHDLLFDDHTFDVRYVVVDTGGWLLGRNVLIAPVAADELGAPTAADTPDVATKTLPVRLKKQQIKDAPDLLADLPLDRQREAEYHDHFEWRYYWLDPTLTAGTIAVIPPSIIAEGEAEAERNAHPVPLEDRDPQLRSVHEFTGYEVQYKGQPVGEVVDFILDGSGWRLPYLVAKLVEHPDEKLVLIPTSNLLHISFPEKVASIDLSVGSIFDAPVYDDSVLRDAAFLKHVQEYYNSQVPVSR